MTLSELGVKLSELREETSWLLALLSVVKFLKTLSTLSLQRLTYVEPLPACFQGFFFIFNISTGPGRRGKACKRKVCFGKVLWPPGKDCGHSLLPPASLRGLWTFPPPIWVPCLLSSESHFRSLHQHPTSFHDKSVPSESNSISWVLLWLSHSFSCLQVESSFCFGELFDLIFIVKNLQHKI